MTISATQDVSQNVQFSTVAAKYIDGMVVLPLTEYKALLSQVPTYYLNGKSARALDHLVQTSLAEHHANKTKMISSLADLDA